jgi:hypothetical protein
MGMTTVGQVRAKGGDVIRTTGRSQFHATPTGLDADFHYADPQGGLRLNCEGTPRDLANAGLVFREGMQLSFHADDLGESDQLDERVVDGIVSHSADEKCWMATIGNELDMLP